MPDGRLDRGGEHDRLGGVQHHRRPGGGGRRVPHRRADHDDRPRRDPPGAPGPRLGGGAAGAGHLFGRVAAELTDYALDRNIEWSGSTTTAIHDAVAVAHLMVPDLVAVARTTSPSTRRRARRAAGPCATGCPTGSGATAAQPNADVGIVIDRGRFARLLIDAFARLP